MDKIQEVGSELVEYGFLVESVTKDVNVILERGNILEKRAIDRKKMLEEEVSEAEKSQTFVMQLEQWLTKVDDILSEHIENDVTVEDLPDDFQVNINLKKCFGYFYSKRIYIHFQYIHCQYIMT